MSVVVAGEALVDLAPRDGLLLPLPGGSPYNVAVGLGRLGSETHYLGGLSTGRLRARCCARRLAADGVALDLAPVRAEPDHPGRGPPRRAGAGELRLLPRRHGGRRARRGDDLPELPEGAALHVSFGAIGLGHDRPGGAWRPCSRSSIAQRLTSLDPNVRSGQSSPRMSAQALLSRVLVGVGPVGLLQVVAVRVGHLAGALVDVLDQRGRQPARRGWPRSTVATNSSTNACTVEPTSSCAPTGR
jgi:fructokinase